MEGASARLPKQIRLKNKPNKAKLHEGTKIHARAKSVHHKARQHLCGRLEKERATAHFCQVGCQGVWGRAPKAQKAAAIEGCGRSGGELYSRVSVQCLKPSPWISGLKGGGGGDLRACKLQRWRAVSAQGTKSRGECVM